VQGKSGGSLRRAQGARHQAGRHRTSRSISAPNVRTPHAATLTAGSLRTAGAGSVAALWSVTNAIAFASLVFSVGDGAALSAGIAATLLGFAVTSIAVAAGTGTPGIGSAMIGASVVVQAAALGTIDGLLAERGVPAGPERIGAILVASAALTAMVGALLAALGMLRAGALVRLLPSPVVAGFLCGLGTSLVHGAIEFAAAGKLSVEALPAALGPAPVGLLAMTAVVGALLVLLPRWIGVRRTMLGVLGGAVSALHLARVAAGVDIAAAQAGGWLFGPLPGGTMLAVPTRAAFAQADAEVLFVLLPFAASSAVLAAVSLALMVRGIEDARDTRMRIDREIALAGAGNLAGGLVGAMPAGHGLVTTTLLARLGAPTRAAATVPGLIAVALALLDSRALAWLPVPVVAGMLLAFGIEWMVVRTREQAAGMPWHDRVVLGLVALGIVPGLLIGLGLALVIFLWVYRGLPVIGATLTGEDVASSVTRSEAALALLRRERRRIVLLRLQGYLFFLNARRMEDEAAAQIEVGARVLVLDLGRLSGADSSAVESFRRIRRRAARAGVRLIIASAPPALAEAIAGTGGAPAAAVELVGSIDDGLARGEEVLLVAFGGPPADETVRFEDHLAATGATTEEIARLGAAVERFGVGQGEVLMREREPATDVMFIERGRFSVTLGHGTARATHLRILTAGNFVGEVAMLRGGVRTASVIAEAPAQVVRLTGGTIDRLFREDPAAAAILQRAIAQHLAEKLTESSRAVRLAHA
jgi:SulP family sulfate permease